MAAWALLLAVARPGLAAPVLMISVDGMKPEYVLEADARGLRIPYLRGLVSQGAYAEGVVGVWPTVTYPSHTTLVTGVAPAQHGILDNLEFDPQHHFDDSWFWYAAQIRVPTLWQAAHEAGLATASIGWPVTVGATGIDYLIPEYWRTSGPTENLNPSERYLIEALSLPVGMLTQLQSSLGPYMNGNDTTLHGDEVKTRFAIDILRKRKPGFMTLHLSSLDAAEHGSGAFSSEANQDLEAIDGMLSRLAAAALAANPATIVAVVSDHGFTALTHKVNLYVPLLRSGWITRAPDSEGKAPKIESWKAQPWLAGGMAAIMLHDPGDRDTERAVGELLRSLAAEPANGIAHVADHAEIERLGGFPGAAYLVVFKSGYYAGGNWTGDLVTDMPGGHGGHGFSPEFADMRASLFVTGAGIAHHRDLGIIDMRQIAPTMAQLLGVSLPASNAVPLHVTIR
jgi:predicted AlkP superfamily pyrophosphatase or phosphodiesterase